MDKIKVIIAGGRDFNDYAKMETMLDLLFSSKMPNIEIVCGGSKGADNLGAIYGKNRRQACRLSSQRRNGELR